MSNLDYDSGRPTIGDVEALARFIQGISHAEECARGLAHSRKDERWLVIARALGQIQNKAAQVAHKAMAAN
jgi:hypothetical protein